MPPRKKKKKKDRVIPPETGVEQIAAIDIGSSSIRLALAEFGADNKMRRHETLSQNVSIGSDTFTCGEILRRQRQRDAEFEFGNVKNKKEPTASNFG